MTLDKYEEIHFLKVLLERTDEKDKPNFFYDELIDAVRVGRMHPDRVKQIFNQFQNKEYLHSEDDPNNAGNKLYFISDAGRWYYNFLLDEADEEKMDDKIKELTISNTSFTRNIAFASLFVAGITAFVPIVIWRADKHNVQNTKTEIPQLEQVIREQEQIQQTLQEIQRRFQSVDTSVKGIKIEKN